MKKEFDFQKEFQYQTMVHVIGASRTPTCVYIVNNITILETLMVVTATMKVNAFGSQIKENVTQRDIQLKI